ncbi:hypothetical protein [Streptomyces sp. NPDC016845]|uniref:hypothetical protein n=1 Tax=Streptomyces sp. NPDC016845 TaxID=3364972 RepID=UPI00379218E1
MAHAVDNDTATATEADAGAMPSLVEDFNYPGADRIAAETDGVVLKRGNGRLIMVPCDGAQTITILSRTGNSDYCFRVTAKPAFLTMELPKAYGIWTGDDPVKTTLKETDGTTTVITAKPNDFTGYGESGAEVNPSTLIELRV